MLPPQLRKFTDLYENYGLGAVKNIWLLTCLIPLARTVNLNKLKDALHPLRVQGSPRFAEGTLARRILPAGHDAES